MSSANAEQLKDPGSRTRARLELLALALGAGLGLWLLHAEFGDQNVAFEALALGPDTTSYFARIDGDPIHCNDISDADACLQGYVRRGSRPAVLWLGNSQLHALNSYEQGQETATPILHRNLEAEGLDFVTFSQPNANLQEHLVLYLWLAERLKLKAVVLPMVFDDCRETGVREKVARALRDPGVVARLEQTQIGKAILANAARTESAEDDLAALSGTFQERTESALVGWLDARWPLWAQRPQVRGSLMKSLFRLRNVVFGIRATSARRMIPGRLALNLDAARALLDDARERGIATVVYVAPLRGDVPPPYVLSEYAQFREDVALLAAERGARFADLDALVPAENWGKTLSSGFDDEGDLDFMHFGAPGHVLLANAVEQLLRGALGDES